MKCQASIFRIDALCHFNSIFSSFGGNAPKYNLNISQNDGAAVSLLPSCVISINFQFNEKYLAFLYIYLKIQINYNFWKF